ncbi:MAG: hypothetical protein K2X66_10030 [Cyanobacteria bacterium]|nr:hypothetical protein [Cyanobacteriota bacterium]
MTRPINPNPQPSINLFQTDRLLGANYKEFQDGNGNKGSWYQAPVTNTGVVLNNTLAGAWNTGVNGLGMFGSALLGFPPSQYDPLK